MVADDTPAGTGSRSSETSKAPCRPACPEDAACGAEGDHPRPGPEGGGAVDRRRAAPGGPLVLDSAGFQVNFKTPKPTNPVTD